MCTYKLHIVHMVYTVCVCNRERPTIQECSYNITYLHESVGDDTETRESVLLEINL